MTTPEGKVKVKVREVLKEYNVYYLQPVQFGYGPAGLDFHCVVRFCNTPLAFFIETKRPGKDLTPRQEKLRKELVQGYNAIVFKIEDDAGVEHLRQWLKQVQSVSQMRTRSLSAGS